LHVDWNLANCTRRSGFDIYGLQCVRTWRTVRERKPMGSLDNINTLSLFNLLSSGSAGGGTTGGAGGVLGGLLGSLLGI
jgi:hypothetical protein